MSESMVTGLLALALVVLLYKISGILIRLVVVGVILGFGYYWLSPVFGWPVPAL
jgi:hypothetical protein